MTDLNLLDPNPYYDRSADSWHPDNHTPYLGPEHVTDDALHEWGHPDSWGQPTSPDSGQQGFGGWAA